MTAPSRSIPRILHQTWKSELVPAHLARHMQTWDVHNPDWTHLVWTDEDVSNFIAKNYPRMSSLYESYSLDIMRVDFFRYLLLYHFGGLYADLDYECFRPFLRLLDDCNLLLGWEWGNTPRLALGTPESVDLREASDWFRAENTLGNAIMASVPRHPLWLIVLQTLIRAQPSSSIAFRPRWVWGTTGPEFLTKLFLENARPDWGYRLLDNSVLYPIAWQAPCLTDGANSSRFPSAYGAHHFAGTWWQPQPEVLEPPVFWRRRSNPVGDVLPFDADMSRAFGAGRKPGYDSRRATFVITSFSRPYELGRIIDAALGSASVDNILVSHHNPTVDLADFGLTSNPRIRIATSDIARRAAFRWQVISEICDTDYIVVVDDDTILTSEQIELLMAQLVADPSRPHGVVGSRFPSEPYVDPITGRATNTYHERADTLVDILHQVYGVTSTHVSAFFRLTQRLPSFLRWQFEEVGDDIVISNCGDNPAAIHDIGTVVEATSSWDPAIAVHAEPGFNDKRAAILADLDRLRLRHRTSGDALIPSRQSSIRHPSPTQSR